MSASAFLSSAPPFCTAWLMNVWFSRWFPRVFGSCRAHNPENTATRGVFRFLASPAGPNPRHVPEPQSGAFGARNGRWSALPSAPQRTPDKQRRFYVADAVARLGRVEALAEHQPPGLLKP